MENQRIYLMDKKVQMSLVNELFIEGHAKLITENFVLMDKPLKGIDRRIIPFRNICFIDIFEDQGGKKNE